jgi:hypothetical protein
MEGQGQFAIQTGLDQAVASTSENLVTRDL